MLEGAAAEEELATGATDMLDAAGEYTLEAAATDTLDAADE